MVRAGVIAELPADFARLADGVVTSDECVAASGHKKSSKNAKQRGLTSTIGSQKGQGFAFANLERKPIECHGRNFFEWLEESSPAGARRRKQFHERFDGDGGLRHLETYSLSAVRRQSRLFGICAAAAKLFVLSRTWRSAAIPGRILYLGEPAAHLGFEGREFP